LNSFLPHEMKYSVSKYPANSREKPASVLLYNQKMGGVDHVDQMLAPYESLRKSLKWYKKFAFHLLDIAVYNSHIVYNYKNPESKITFKEYLLKLITEILSLHKVTRSLHGRPTTQHVDKENNAHLHLPEKVLNPNGAPNYSDCVVCRSSGLRKQTPFKCAECKKRFCINSPNSCFKTFHNS
jgi:hypothetical protein